MDIESFNEIEKLRADIKDVYEILAIESAEKERFRSLLAEKNNKIRGIIEKYKHLVPDIENYFI